MRDRPRRGGSASNTYATSASASFSLVRWGSEAGARSLDRASLAVTFSGLDDATAWRLPSPAAILRDHPDSAVPDTDPRPPTPVPPTPLPPTPQNPQGVPQPIDDPRAPGAPEPVREPPVDRPPVVAGR